MRLIDQHVIRAVHAQSAIRSRTHDPVRGQTVLFLERDHRFLGTRAEDAVRLQKKLEREKEEAEKERQRAERRAANPDGITENTSKKKLAQKQQKEADAAKAAAAKEYAAKKGLPTEPEAEEEDQAQKPDEKKKFRLRPWLMILAAAALFVLGIIFLPSVGHEKGGYTIDWFEQETANEPGQAYIHIYTKTELPVAVKQQTEESTPVWEYNLFFKEENGVGVTVDELTRVRFYKKGKTDIYAQTTDVFGENNGGKPSYISGREFRRLTYGCRADSKSVGDGWMLRGTDDKGRKVCFRVYIPFETQ